MGKMRNCPDCKSSLDSRVFDGITIDACQGCAGIFFDSGEVGQVKAKGLALLQEIEDAIAPTVEVTQAVDGLRLCPCCNTGMHKFRYQYSSNIVLDECEKCGGIWVQDGELKRIKEYVLANDPHARKVSVSTENEESPEPVHFFERISKLGLFLRGAQAFEQN